MKYIFLGMALFAATAKAQVTSRHLLQPYTAQVGSILVSRESWKPFPQTPAGWKAALPDSMLQRIIAGGEKALGFEFRPIPASLFLEYVRTGNRVNYEEASFGRRNILWSLVLAEAVEGKGRFTDKILDGLWSICEETYWGLPAHVGVQKAGSGLPDVEEPTVDLFSAETAAILAWTDYFAGVQLQKISPLIRPRIYYEVNRRVLEPLKTAKYGYLGGGRTDVKLNNWAPWVMSNYCTAALLLEKDAAARAQAVSLAMHYTDLYLDGLGEDGGCEEGPTYWTAAGACVFDILNLLYDATGGKINIYRQPLVQKMGAYIYKTHIAGKYFINVADAAPQLVPDGTMIYRFGRDMGDTVMEGFGSWIMHTYPSGAVSYEHFHRTRSLYDLLAQSDCAVHPPAEPVVKNVWFGDIQLMVARNAQGLFVAAHGGNNGESHNHNDVGDFVVYSGGQPVIVDVGSGTYTSRTFSSHRYDLWFNTSAYHNLPVVNGFQQKEGAAFAAADVRYLSNGALTMDIGKAYPAEAGIGELRRVVRMEEKGVTITDSYTMRAPLQSLTQSFMTVCPVDIGKAGVVLFTTDAGQKVGLTYDAGMWEASVEKVGFGLPEEEGVWQHWGGRAVYRVLLKAKKLSSSVAVWYITSYGV